jgi:alkanesulfonate monooxygenase SsuD/methylene tetrahydromethanopterin reductase-like flavin-dependent oxidoreductase (luciferase family)
MQFGTYYFLQATPGRSADAIIADEVEQMVLSEQLGFDSVWLTEHHYADYGISSAPSVLLATVAARTERVKLGMAVWVLPFHHPLRLAEETATLDILSRGRLVVGLGRGNRPQEFLGHGVNQDESRSRMEEGVEVLRKAWTEERVTFHGRHWSFDEIPVYPKPLTRPHPPLAFAVSSPQSLEWAGTNGFPILSSGLTTPLEALQRQRETYVAALHAAGHPELTISDLLGRWIVSKHVYVAPTDEEARAEAEGPEKCHRRGRPRGIAALGGAGRGPAVHRLAGDGAAEGGAAPGDRGGRDALLDELRGHPAREGAPLDAPVRG